MPHFTAHCTAVANSSCTAIVCTDDSNYNTDSNMTNNSDYATIESFQSRVITLRDTFGNVIGSKSLAPTEFVATFPITIINQIALLVKIECNGYNGSYLVERVVYLSCVAQGGL